MTYKIGVSKADATYFEKGIGFMGYGQPHNYTEEVATPLLARALILEKNIRFILVHLEQCFVTEAIKDEVILRLNKKFPDWEIQEKDIVITAQHTHAAPGGYSHYPFYNFTIPDFRTKVFEKIVSTVLTIIEEASRQMKEVTLEFGDIEIDSYIDVAFNRSLKSYLNNPEAKDEDQRTAVNRRMDGLFFKDLSGEIVAFLNWFGVHATSISSFNKRIHHDNKGVAARIFEERNPGTVAFFLQEAAGDISPNFIWDKKLKRMRGKFEDQYESAEYNGELQYYIASAISGTHLIEGDIESRHAYLDMGKAVAPPAHGVAFLQGTAEGPGISALLANALIQIAKIYKRVQLIKDPKSHQDFYRAQSPKNIALDHRSGTFIGIPLNVWKHLPPLPDPVLESLRRTARKDALTTLPWVPDVLPFQSLKVGPLFIAFVPGEITVTAANRLKAHLKSKLSSTDIEKIIISSYANTYMGYIVTQEEYDLQAYEAGHTVYGRATLNGIFQGFDLLVAPESDSLELSSTQPRGFPIQELMRRSQ